ncbi:flagellar filament capping protein FliD [Cellvibrio mixtus]|uniref:flagellar filament capping protein FliD n=1 Tax=Cellvibrio mixtus TaxID=39650 RepID=UPI000693CDD4|nr:flagellar filament capping protein FliD [Cellvibrio mixtus]
MVSSTTSSTNSNASTGSSIISALGTGSGIDSNKLADQLTEANKQVQAQRLTTKKTLLETQISDYGLMRSALSKLESAASALGSADTFNAKSLSVPDTKLLSITKLDAKAAAGGYQLKVEQVAQSQSVSSGTFSSMTDPIGKGTLVIRLGEWNAAGTDFEVDSSKVGGGTITIDDSNNSLTGLRDAINKANMGVSASIVGDGGSYRLLLTAKSGAKNEIEITATEDAGALGLAKFDFNETTRNMTQQQEGLDAKIRVNGLLVSRESNQIKDVIDGLEFDLFGASLTETISVSINEDKSVGEKAIRDFVAAYNTFKTEVEKLVGFDTELKDYGSLKTDPLAKSLTQGIRNLLSSAVPGLGDSGFSSLSSLGIRTERDGSLKIVEDEENTGFRAAIDKHYDMVRDLFVPKKSSSAANIELNKYTAQSKPGTYDVVITQQPSKGKNTGAAMGITFPLDTTGKDYNFKVKLDGTESALITIPAGKTYASAGALAADIQSLINLDANIKGVKSTVAVSVDAGKLVFTSDSYGSTSKVEFTAVSSDMDDLGIALGSGTAGTDVGGTVAGKVAFGYGNVLLPALGSDAEGLSMTVQPGATGGTITFSRGLAGGLSNQINDYLKSSGIIKERETTINKDIKKVEEDETALTRRSDAYRARLMSQFQAMESIVRSLNSTGDFLDGILDRLPFTSKN